MGGIIQTLPLCEVEAFNRMEGFGIFVTIRVVGRATLLELMRQEPFMEGICLEVTDTVPASLDLPNMVASNIENFVLTLSSLEHRLKSVMENENANDDLDAIQDDGMRSWVKQAELDAMRIAEEDDAETLSLDDDDGKDMNDQFLEAFLQAKDSDTQGYMISSTDEEPRKDCRDARDLTAMSWAAFCIHGVEEPMRLQALDCDNLFDRLKIGSYMLREKKAQLEAKLALIGVRNKKEKDEDA